MKRIALLAAFLTAPVAASASQPAPSPERQIDALFAPWNRPGVPGAVIEEDKALALIRRQRTLDFEPGQEWDYSNTGYVLLARIVEHVAGKPFPEFARERIFVPLGMTHTLFQQDYRTLVPGRVLSYVPADTGGYRLAPVNISMAGDGGVLTTLGDLALWDRNFYDGRVGGMDVVRQMQATGVLNDGKPIEYASALFVHTYRGLRLVEHSGMAGGYGNQLWRFPDQHLSVMVFANTSDIDTDLTVRRIADMVLDRVPGAAPAEPMAPVKTFQPIPLDPARLDALAGFYATSPQSGITFTKENGRLMALGMGFPKMPAFPYSERDFFARVTESRFSFDPPDPDGIVAGGVLHWGEQDIPATRTVRPMPSAAQLQRVEGDFYSDELHVLYSIAGKDGDLVLTYPGGTITLGFNGERDYETGFGTLKYQCSADGCTGFTISTERACNVQFTRVALAPASR